MMGEMSIDAMIVCECRRSQWRGARDCEERSDRMRTVG
jgi:hypothetical protein